MCESNLNRWYIWYDILLCYNIKPHTPIQRHIWDVLYCLITIHTNKTFFLCVRVRHQASIEKQCLMYLSAKGSSLWRSSSLCLHENIVKFPTLKIISTMLQPFCTPPDISWNFSNMSLASYSHLNGNTVIKRRP